MFIGRNDHYIVFYIHYFFIFIYLYFYFYFIISYRYELGRRLQDIGVVHAADMTTEAIAAKLSYLLALPNATAATVRAGLPIGLRGEITEQRQHVRLQCTSPDLAHNESTQNLSTTEHSATDTSHIGILPHNNDTLINASTPTFSNGINNHHSNLLLGTSSTTSSVYDLSSHMTEADIGTGTGDIVLRIGAFEEGE